MGIRLIYSLMITVLLLGTLRGEGSILDFFKLKKNQDILERTIQNIKTTNDELNREIWKIKKSSDYARKVLRDKYHITESDERIIFFAD